MDKYNVYEDINKRTGGEIYLGVVGPVRTGKSTFIKGFMDIMVLPAMENIHNKERTIDELPQSSSGRTIMTTEPKFVPKDAAEIEFGKDVKGKVRLIDCVGFMVDGAVGHLEENTERLVNTPWFDEPVPFTKAAEIGTEKVIREHSNIGVVVTADGSFGDLSREQYIEAEERAVSECKKIGKPFIILLNSANAKSMEAKSIAAELTDKYRISAIPVNCQNLKREDIDTMMETILSDFPITRINFNIPKWVEFLNSDHWLKKELMTQVKDVLGNLRYMKDIIPENLPESSQYIKNYRIDSKQLEDGIVNLFVEFEEAYYYQILSDLIGIPIEGEYELISTMRDLAGKRKEFDKIAVACSQVKGKGYGIVTPTKEDIQIENPEMMKHGNKYGVKIKAVCPSIHLIQANIETEIAPIVGNEEQAKDLIQYIESNANENADGIFDTNIFGKTIRELVDDGIQNKVNRLGEESQVKLQDTIQKVVNDSNGGLVCIII
ncbi:MAG: stage IV sporulation protein A [Lachnoclostridium sp.]|jgi:stage IV sporulation protein A|nr:stage IV sporulation protein A [Lachnoclostridium sp.]